MMGKDSENKKVSQRMVGRKILWVDDAVFSLLLIGEYGNTIFDLVANQLQ